MSIVQPQDTQEPEGAAARSRTTDEPASAGPSIWSKSFGSPPYYGITIISLATIFAGWELMVRLMDIQYVVLPPPSEIVKALGDYWADGTLWEDLTGTGRRALTGLALGMSIGVVLGLAIGWVPRIRAAINPILAMTFPIPKIALVPLFIIWFGLGDTFKIWLVVVGVFYVATLNTIAGVESIPKVTVMACRNLGASNRDILTKVVLPASIPVIFAALRIAYSGSLILVVAAEMIVSTNGLGHTIARAGELLKTELVFAGLIVSGVLGVVGYWIIDLAESWLTPWRGRRTDVSARL